MSHQASDRRARRLYRRTLLRLFPAAFRARYGGEMEETFVAHLRRADTPWSRAGVWLRASVDALRGGLRERWGGGVRSAVRDTTTTGGGGMSSLMNDVRYGLRGLRRHPVLSLAAITTLALGIGANTAIFTVANALLLRPLPYTEAERLVMVWAEKPDQGWYQTDVNAADAWDWRARAGVFQDLAVFSDRGMALTGGEHPEIVAGIEATPNLFKVLGVDVASGRAFSPDDGREAAPAVAVVSHGFWQRRFGGDPGILGRELVLDETSHTVVGVLPADFHFLDEAAEVYTAWRTDPASVERGSHGREAIARLRPGVTLTAANRALGDVSSALEREHPETHQGWRASVQPLRDFVLGDVAGRAALVLAGAVAFLLLMACANVANLLLARAGARREEMAVRAALGAGRSRLLRQLLTESAALAVLGGMAGLAVAEWGRRVIVAGMPENLPPVFDFSLDGTVLAFAAAVTLASVLVFGLVPALRTAPPAGELRSGRRVAGGGRLAGGLVVLQTALAVVLLVAGSVLVRSVVTLSRQDFGWDAPRVLYVGVAPSENRYPGAEELRVLYETLEARVAALPGVESVGAIHSAPLQGSNWVTTVRVPGTDGPEQPARAGYVSPDYFRAMGIALRAGRGLTASDGADGTSVALVNQTFARQYLPGRDPVGATVLDAEGSPLQVVGVVEDHVERGVDAAPEPGLYRPLSRHPVRARTLAVRAAEDPAGLVAPVREAIWSVDPDLPLRGVRTLEDLVTMRVGGFRLIAQLMGAFAVLSLLLGAVGIYGVTAHGVGQRRHEIGVRMAMGADRRGVRRMVVWQGMRRAALGMALGTALALPLAGALAGLAVGVDPRDPVVVGGVLATLAVVAFLASWLPARKASGVDPVRALAAE